jgi:hypothetical protein
MIKFSFMKDHLGCTMENGLQRSIFNGQEQVRKLYSRNDGRYSAAPSEALCSLSILPLLAWVSRL